jgi:anaerobic magnesium-protoporphyrin IX monomethyl ester cyclase
MNIILINPPFFFFSKDDIIISQCLGLRSISSYLKSKGFENITFIDALQQGISNITPYGNGYKVGLDNKEILDQIPADVDFIGISVPFSCLARIVHDLIDEIKSKYPEKTVIMGGTYPSTQPTLSFTSKTDYIIIGEGETAFFQLVSGVDPEKITGLFSSNHPKESYTQAAIISDLDTLPFPDYSIPNIKLYLDKSPRVSQMKKVASIITSRGCPYSCEFCSIHPIYGHNYRYRSPENVLEEIKYLIDNFGIKTLEIEDDNFTLRKDRTRKILEGIIKLNEQGAKLKWSTPNGVRIDTLDDELIRLIKESNCSSITLALENGDKEMLKIMNKKLDLDKAYEIIKLLVKYEIPKINIFVIVGYPDETKERFNNSYHYLEKIRKLSDNISLYPNIIQPYPGTFFSKRCLEMGILKEGYDNFLIRNEIPSTEAVVSITTSDMSREDVLARKQSLESLFAKPAPLWKTAIRIMLPDIIYKQARITKNMVIQHLGLE